MLIHNPPHSYIYIYILYGLVKHLLIFINQYGGLEYDLIYVVSTSLASTRLQARFIGEHFAVETVRVRATLLANGGSAKAWSGSVLDPWISVWKI